eukprot:GHVP01059549.1.p1 GENE.GHVP01059549.1~~GHVP01059549.1.p1  ORF type:complete len:591 (+),score=99.79 GHVP01059549.1:71-1843(+)
MTVRGPIIHATVSSQNLSVSRYPLPSNGSQENAFRPQSGFHSIESRMLTSFSDDDLQEFSATRPSLSGEIMSSRIHHSSVMVGNLLLIFGGETDPLAIHSDKSSGKEIEVRKRKLQSYYSVDLLTGRSRMLNTDTSYPPPLSGHCMVALKHKIVIYGCVQNEASMKSCLLVHNLNNDEIYDLELTGPSPPPRLFPACVLLGSNIVIFGGQCPNTGEYLGDLWVLDLSIQDSKWFLITSDHLEGVGPLPRAHTCHVAYDNRMWIFGGKGKSVFCDFWHFDLSNNRWSEIKTLEGSQVPRYGGVSGCLRDIWVIHGGYDAQDNHVREVNAFSFEDHNITSERIDVEIQPRKMLPSLVFHNAASGMLEDEEVLVISGGKTKKPKFINTIYIIKSNFPSLKATIQVTPMKEFEDDSAGRQHSTTMEATLCENFELYSSNNMKACGRQAPVKRLPAAEPPPSSASPLRVQLTQNSAIGNPKESNIFASYLGTIAKTPSPSLANSEVPLHTGEGQPKTPDPRESSNLNALSSCVGLRQNILSLRSQVKNLQEKNEALEDELFFLKKSLEEVEHLTSVIQKIEENDYLRPLWRVLVA